MWYKEVLMYTHKLYYVIICTYITCDIITCIVVRSGAAVEYSEWSRRESEKINERVRESQQGMVGRMDREREMDGQTDIARRERITYIIFYSSNEFYYFIVIQNRLRNPFRLINRCSPRIVYEFGRLIEQ